MTIQTEPPEGTIARFINPVDHPIGTRILVCQHRSREGNFRDLIDITILEYSPKATAVKVSQWNDGSWYRLLPNPYWEIVEVLTPLPLKPINDRVEYLAKYSEGVPISAEVPNLSSE